MDNTYITFLRGINVNGVKIKMTDLQKAFGQMGFSQIQTVLQTGNVLFTTDQFMTVAVLKNFIEKELSEYFQYEAHILLWSKETLVTELNKSGKLDLPDDHHLYYLLYDLSLQSELAEAYVACNHSDKEVLIPSSQGAFWIIPKGETLTSEFGKKVLGKKQYKSRLTSRNINTLAKIALKCS